MNIRFTYLNGRTLETGEVLKAMVKDGFICYQSDNYQLVKVNLDYLRKIEVIR